MEKGFGFWKKKIKKNATVIKTHVKATIIFKTLLSDIMRMLRISMGALGAFFYFNTLTLYTLDKH